MNLAVRKPTSLTEFLEWEDRQELRYEFDGVEPSAMTGGSLRHAAIQRNLAMAIGSRLRGKPCQFFGSDLKIQVAENSSRYADGSVLCSDLNPSLKIVPQSDRHLRGSEPQHRREGPHRQGPRVPRDAIRQAIRSPRAGPYRRDRPRPGPGLLIPTEAATFNEMMSPLITR
jgi:hypothetical protein